MQLGSRENSSRNSPASVTKILKSSMASSSGRQYKIKLKIPRSMRKVSIDI